jgi:hypothetical protein
MIDENEHNRVNRMCPINHTATYYARTELSSLNSYEKYTEVIPRMIGQTSLGSHQKDISEQMMAGKYYTEGILPKTYYWEPKRKTTLREIIRNTSLGGRNEFE